MNFNKKVRTICFWIYTPTYFFMFHYFQLFFWKMFFQQWFSDLQLNNHLQLIRIVFKVAFFLSFFFNFFQYFHGQARRSVFVFLIFFVIFNTINIWNKFSFVSNLSKIVYSTLCVFFFFSKREVQTTDFLFFLNRPFFKSISLNWAAWFLFFS